MQTTTGSAVWTAFLLATGLSSALIIGIELLNPAREMFWNDTKGALVFEAVVLAGSLVSLCLIPASTVLRSRPRTVGVSLLIMAIPIYLALAVVGGIVGLFYGAQYDTG
jgi:hypothetical protein